MHKFALYKYDSIRVPAIKIIRFGKRAIVFFCDMNPYTGKATFDIDSAPLFV